MVYVLSVSKRLEWMVRWERGGMGWVSYSTALVDHPRLS